jgi:hypothetical protein
VGDSYSKEKKKKKKIGITHETKLRKKEGSSKDEQ